VRPAEITWVEPELVCEVEFLEWTREGRLRAPSYKGLRDDKEAGNVHREHPRKASAGSPQRPLELSNLPNIGKPRVEPRRLSTGHAPLEIARIGSAWRISCTGCGECVEICPADAIFLAEEAMTW